MTDRPTRKKGFFGAARLPVAKAYVYPKSRYAMLLAGGVGAVLVLAVFAFNVIGQQGGLVSNGPLSSAHASFGEDCASCHTPFGDVEDQKCAVCHEKYGDEVGLHTFAAHYLYRTNDFTRVVPQPGEGACLSCHTEHVGRDAGITRVPDGQCLPCHDYGSFNRAHPEFEFAAENLEDDANLKFPHTLHVLELRDRLEETDLEKLCLYCHNPEPDGAGFEPLAFEEHCGDCHLTATTATPWLPAGNPANTASPGVLTLADLQRSQAPGTRWTFFANPGDFQDRGGTVRKRPLYHEDPWVLENLRRLRAVLYPGHPLADLLNASADVEEREARQLYEEALATLRAHAEELRSLPDRTVQRELGEVEALLRLVERRLRDPYAPLDETRFLVSSAALDTSLTAAQVAAYDSLALNLTQACQECHRVEQATILRAQADQSSLYRAEFDHRAHIIQTGCLDCHDALPIRRAFATNIPDSTTDVAEVYNLPTIATCQTCHAAGKAANTCITCHAFHPDTESRANLLPYLQ